MTINSCVSLLRPRQWLKNLILFFPPFLGGSLLLSPVWHFGGQSFFAFCLASSATYVVNDIRDCESDRNHPRKRYRPIADGRVTVRSALVLALCLVVGAFILGWTVSLQFAGWIGAYLTLSFAYSLGLKNQPIFDIFCIASGFVFRLFAGGTAFSVKVSDWLFLSVLLLSLFLSCGKRLSEKGLLGEHSSDHRKSLDAYPPGSLDGFMLISGAAVLVTYTMYVISKHRLIFTVPLCCFGLFRYLILVKRGESGDPTDSLLRDPVLFVVGLLWVLSVGLVTYLR